MKSINEKLFKLLNNRGEIEKLKYIEYDNILKDRYIISSYGRIFINGVQLNQKISDGYKTVVLKTDDNKTKTYFVHELVAYHFIENADELIKNNYVVAQVDNIRSVTYYKSLFYVKL